MKRLVYREFVEKFKIESLGRELAGNLQDGLNVCEEICDKYADSGKTALYYEGNNGAASSHTFSELKAKSAQFANFLDSRGIGRGERVACLLPRTPELMVVALGVLRAGAVYQPLFTAFGPRAIECRLEQAGASLIVTDEANHHKLKGVNNLPTTLLVTKDERAQDSLGGLNFEAEVYSRAETFDPIRIGAEDPFLQMFTSGTVGKSKGILIPARALLSFCAYMKYAIDLRPDDRYWNVADPGWAYGLYYSVVGPLQLGCATHFNEHSFTAENTFDMLHRYRITNLAAAPTAYRMLMANDHLLAGSESFELRVASSAGEPLNPEVIHWAKDKLGCTVMDHYGQTETGMTVCNYHALEHAGREGSMGYSMPGYRLVALDSEYEEVGKEETGQLAIDVEQSPLFFFQGYTWGQSDPFRGKYYLTGDVVKAHGDSAFSFVGRDDDIIISAGYRIGPADVESTLIEHESVAESGVIGKPDQTRGSIVMAYVVLKRGFTPSQELSEELKRFVRDRLSTHSFPREIVFVQDLPKTPSGKIQRFVLRRQAAG